MLYSVEKLVKDPLEIDFGDIEAPSKDVQELINNLPSVNEIKKEDVFSIADSNTLFIIGNGFDNHHSLSTKYTDFRDYLKDNDTKLLDALENNFGLDRNKDYLWNSFEDRLKHCESIPYDQNVSVSKKTASTPIADLINQIYYIELNLNQRIFNWIRDKAQEKISKEISDKELLLQNSDSLFLSFNYTTVLEDCYGIPESQIFHIHGKFSKNNKEQLFVGFGDTNFNVLENYQNNTKCIKLVKPEGESINKMSLKGKDNALSIFSKEDRDRLFAFFTNRNKSLYLSEFNLYNFNIRILRKLSEVNKVIILGHSLGTSDVLSLKLLRDKLGDHVHWYLGIYSKLENKYINNFSKIALYKMLLDQEHLNYFKW